MNKTSIEWTDFTWNPIRARRTDGLPQSALADGPRTGTFCTRISPGCTNCYASTINKRFGTGLEYTVPNLEKHEFYIDERILAEPLRRKKPAMIFVGDMFDLFHENIPTEFVAEVLRIAIKCPRHTFQFLTKRAKRMRDLVNRAQEHWEQRFPEHMWFGVSIEDNKCAIERIPRLQETEAAVRFLSVEPQLEDINFEPDCGDGMPTVNMLRGAAWCDPAIPGIDWVIVGGESGPGARPFNLTWAESLQVQCKAAGVPLFMKQLGSNVIQGGERRIKKDRKGGDMHEWPHELRVREFPRGVSR